MTIQELNTKLTKELKSFIKNKGYVDSGKLLNSINFNCTFIDNELKIKFNAMDYIKYLDNSELLNDFYELKIIKNLIQEFYTDNLDL